MAGWIVVPDGIGITEDPGVEVAHWMSFLFLLFFSRCLYKKSSKVKYGEIMGPAGFYGIDSTDRLHTLY